MHTPRFSGQPFSAGDLVLVMIPSLPIRTSCENVGTVVPRFKSSKFSVISFKFDRSTDYLKLTTNNFVRAQTDCDDSRFARSKIRESTPTGVKVYCESGETSKKLRTHSKRENYAPGFESERLTRLFGAGAPFRPLFCPIPSNLFRDRRIPIHPTIQKLPELNGRYCLGKIPLNKHKV